MTLGDDVHHERTELLEALGSLDPRQWTEPSLCSEWTARDVVAHLVGYDCTSSVVFVLLFIATGFSVNRTNAMLVRRWRVRRVQRRRWQRRLRAFPRRHW